jgi:hypothetical protein
MQDDRHDSFQGLVTGEPRETETLMRGSEAGRQKSALKVTRCRPSLQKEYRAIVVLRELRPASERRKAAYRGKGGREYRRGRGVGA